jgi:hypothetical protein
VILTVFTAITYPVVIQYKRGGLWQVLAPFAAAVLLVDVLASYTEWSLIFGPPKKGDHTITQRIKTMHSEESPSRREFARLVQVYLDACEPDGKH